MIHLNSRTFTVVFPCKQHISDNFLTMLEIQLSEVLFLNDNSVQTFAFLPTSPESLYIQYRKRIQRRNINPHQVFLDSEFLIQNVEKRFRLLEEIQQKDWIAFHKKGNSWFQTGTFDHQTSLSLSDCSDDSTDASSNYCSIQHGISGPNFQADYLSGAPSRATTASQNTVEQIWKLEQENSELKVTNSELYDKLQTTQEEFQSERQHLRDEIIFLKNENFELRKQIETQNSTIKEKNKIVDHLQNQVNQLQDQFQRISTKFDLALNALQNQANQKTVDVKNDVMIIEEPEKYQQLEEKQKLDCLQNGRWINDLVINDYFLKRHNNLPHNLLLCKTFAIPKVKEYLRNRLDFREIRKKKWVFGHNHEKEIFEKDLIIFPVHSLDLHHWCVLVVVNPKGILENTDTLTSFIFLDSKYRSYDREIVQGILKLFDEYAHQIGLIPKIHSNSTFEIRTPSVPQQTNDFDCGLFTLHFIDLVIQDPQFFLTHFRGCLTHWFDPISLQTSMRKNLINFFFNS